MCVLFVDDEPLTRLLMSEGVSEAGHDVVTAESAVDALEQLKKMQVPLSCLVTDVHMPGGVHGMKLVELVRPSYPGLPVIIATALVHFVTPDWRAAFGVILLEKPYTPPALVGLIGRLLAN